MIHQSAVMNGPPFMQVLFEGIVVNLACAADRHRSPFGAFFYLPRALTKWEPHCVEAVFSETITGRFP